MMKLFLHFSKLSFAFSFRATCTEMSALAFLSVKAYLSSRKSNSSLLFILRSTLFLINSGLFIYYLYPVIILLFNLNTLLSTLSPGTSFQLLIDDCSANKLLQTKLVCICL